MVLRRLALLVSLCVVRSDEVVALCMIATGTDVVKTSLARLLSSIVDFAPHHEVFLRADGAAAKRVDALERKPSKLRITVALDAYAGRSRRTMERGCPSRTAEPCLWTRYQLEKTAVLRDALMADSRRGALYVDSDLELFAPPPPFPGGRVALSHARMREDTRKAFGTYNGGSILVRDPAVPRRRRRTRPAARTRSRWTRSPPRSTMFLCCRSAGTSGGTASTRTCPRTRGTTSPTCPARAARSSTGARPSTAPTSATVPARGTAGPSRAASAAPPRTARS